MGRSAKLRSKILFVIMLAICPSIAMDLESPSTQDVQGDLAKRIQKLVRATLDASVRAYMYRFPDNQDVQLLNRYIGIATDNYINARNQHKHLPPQVTEQFLSSAICKENLLAIVNVNTVADLKFRLGALGILYDEYQPCNTWKHLLTVMQERIKLRARCESVV